MSTYTVKSTMPTGKSDPKFGTEFYVQFDEMSDAPALWFKNQPETGSTLDLEQVNGKWKKVKKEWNPQNSPNATTPSAPSAKPAYKDNSDGMRQGMWINNAASYVNTLEFEKALTDAEWAQTVFSYAEAGYRLGDLKMQPEASQEPVDPKTAAEVFANGQ